MENRIEFQGKASQKMALKITLGLLLRTIKPNLQERLKIDLQAKSSKSEITNY